MRPGFTPHDYRRVDFPGLYRGPVRRSSLYKSKTLSVYRQVYSQYLADLAFLLDGCSSRHGRKVETGTQWSRIPTHSIKQIMQNLLHCQ
jgi:hypothetical protein